MYPTPKALIGLLFLTATAGARVPTASEVVQRTAAWVKELPRTALTYTLRDDVKDIGAAMLTPEHRLESDYAALSTSPAVALFGALLQGGGEEALRQGGVDTQTTSLYHLNRRVVVIVGAPPMAPGAKQVWLDRETGAPVRILLGEGGALTLEGYDAPRTAGRLPSRFEWVGGSERILGALAPPR